jgi:NADPH2:quinone reductase
MAATFKFIDHGEGGGPEVLRIAERERQAPTGRQVEIEVAYAGVNRPEVLQRAGSYAPPPGASPYLGLEVSGTIVAVGPDAKDRKVGDQVCALTPGGGYAEYCLADERHCLPVPRGVDLRAAACIPENYFTVWTNVFERGALKAGETILVHGGSSGIGLTAIQLAQAFGAHAWTTVGNQAKADACKQAGAERTILYKDEDFEAVVKTATEGRGVNVILDMVGGNYIDKNIRSLAIDGRMVQIAFLEGSKTSIDAMPIMTKRLTFTGSTLRPRSDEDKGKIAAALIEKVVPLIEQGKCLPVIYAEFALADAARAHALMESSQHIGKIVLTVRQ